MDQSQLSAASSCGALICLSCHSNWHEQIDVVPANDVEPNAMGLVAVEPDPWLEV